MDCGTFCCAFQLKWGVMELQENVNFSNVFNIISNKKLFMKISIKLIKINWLNVVIYYSTGLTHWGVDWGFCG